MIIFITGGTRSGKSRYAQKRALALCETPVYIATARVEDDEFRQRVQRHIADRDARWSTIEEPVNLAGLDVPAPVAVVDCLTLWLSNLMHETREPVHALLAIAQKQIDALTTSSKTWILVSNEIGMGLHADTELGRRFVDLQGWVNQHAAQRAAEVVFMVAGLPMIVKSATA